MFRYHILALLIGTILDFFIGDPHDWFHPIKVIGKWISTLEIVLLGNEIVLVEKEERKKRGVYLVLLVVAPTLLITLLIMYVCYSVSITLGVIVEAILSCYCLAHKSLYLESKAVVDAYCEGGLDKARYALSMIVGRDTKELDVTEIMKATIETIAENSSDGIIAPLFYLLIGGPVLGLSYKAINTMDSMVGYHNERYEDFGCPAAKLDDVANYIPSRLTGWLTVFTAKVFPGDFDGKNAKYIFMRDRLNHKSPNSAQSEAAFAGALGVQLGGGASYFGTFVEKPTIGDADKEIEISDVSRAHTLMRDMVFVCQLFLVLILILN